MQPRAWRWLRWCEIAKFSWAKSARRAVVRTERGWVTRRRRRRSAKESIKKKGWKRRKGHRCAGNDSSEQQQSCSDKKERLANRRRLKIAIPNGICLCDMELRRTGIYTLTNVDKYIIYTYILYMCVKSTYYVTSRCTDGWVCEVRCGLISS